MGTSSTRIRLHNVRSARQYALALLLLGQLSCRCTQGMYQDNLVRSCSMQVVRVAMVLHPLKLIPLFDHQGDMGVPHLLELECTDGWGCQKAHLS